MDEDAGSRRAKAALSRELRQFGREFIHLPTGRHFTAKLNRSGNRDLADLLGNDRRGDGMLQAFVSGKSSYSQSDAALGFSCMDQIQDAVSAERWILLQQDFNGYQWEMNWSLNKVVDGKDQ